jgi:predicted nucleic acid-binding protein
MGWLNQLYGTIIGLDTAPLIYFVEKHPKYLPLVYPFFQAVERGDLQVVTSTLTLTEVLVHPYKRGDMAAVKQYSQMLLNTRNIETLPVSPEIATEAARLRAAFGLKTPDSIQLATAKIGSATSFFSNDNRIAAVPGLELVLLEGLMGTP